MSNLKAKPSPAEIAKQRNALIAKCLTEMGTALNQEITTERITLYCRALSDVSLKPLAFGFAEGLKHLGLFPPAPEQIREFASQYVPADPIAATRQKFLERGPKPDDWQPVSAEEIEELKRKVRESAREMPSSVEIAELLAQERNGLSEVPKNHEDRAPWAKRKAVEQGWKS